MKLYVEQGRAGIQGAKIELSDIKELANMHLVFKDWLDANKGHERYDYVLCMFESLKAENALSWETDLKSK